MRCAKIFIQSVLGSRAWVPDYSIVSENLTDVVAFLERIWLISLSPTTNWAIILFFIIIIIALFFFKTGVVVTDDYYYFIMIGDEE